MDLRSDRALPPEARQEAHFEAADSAGIFVGVRLCEEPLMNDVDFAVDDAVDLAHVFVFELGLILPGQVVLAIEGEPQKATSREALQSLLAHGAVRSPATAAALYRLVPQMAMKTGRRGLFLFTFAGHGFFDRSGDLLVTREFVARRPTDTGLPFTKLMSDISVSIAPRRLVFLDACRTRLKGTRAAQTADPEASASFEKAILRARGAAIIASTTMGGTSYDDPARRNGVFTSSVIEVLRGASETAASGPYLTVGDLAATVDEKVRHWVALHRQEHDGKSLGIACTFDPEAMRHLPLAVDSSRLEELQTFRERCRRGLAKLKAHLEPPLTGAIFDEVRIQLENGALSAAAKGLLDSIDRLDGSLPAREAFLALHEKRRREARNHSDQVTQRFFPVKKVASLLVGRPWRRAATRLGASFALVLAALLTFPGFLTSQAKSETWRIVIPTVPPTPGDGREITGFAGLPGLLSQKLAQLAPQVVSICSDCSYLKKEIQDSIGADYQLQIYPPTAAGHLSAEIWGPNGVSRGTIQAEYELDPTETVDPLASRLLAELKADGFVPSPEQMRLFTEAPSGSPEALQLNNQAAADLNKADAVLATRAPDAAVGPPGIAEPTKSYLNLARTGLSRALELDPNFAAAMANRAWLAELEGLSAAAYRDYQRASRLAGRYAPFSYQLGRFLLYSGAGLEKDSNILAIQALEVATGLDPFYWQAFNELGNARLRAGRNFPAEEALDRALEYVPFENRWVVEKNLGRAQLRLHNFAEAGSHLMAARRRAGALEPYQLAEVDYHLAIFHSLSGNRRLACQSLAAAHANDPTESLPLLEPELIELERLKDCDAR